MTKITLSSDELSRIDDFVQEMWDAGKTSKAGNSKKQFFQAYTQGKGAEMAFAKFLRQKGVSCTIDLDVYEGSDDGDLKRMATDDGETFSPTVEVKVCPHYGKWVAIPHSTFHLIDDDEPIVQVKHHSNDEYEIAGWCLPDEMFTIAEGEKPFTQYGDNECRRISQLNTDWNELVQLLSDGRTTTDTAGETQCPQTVGDNQTLGSFCSD